MAARVVQNVESDYLMCSICLGRYDDPRLLPCGHTFCRQCLSEHIQQTVVDRNSRQFNCPIDRGGVKRPVGGNKNPRDWAAFFPEDRFLTSLLHAVRVHEESGGTGPPPSPPAGWRPGPGRMVEPQREYHPEQEDPVQPPRVIAEGITCVEHPGRALEFFCLGCNVLVCAVCAVRNHRTQRCECIEVNEALNRLRPRIEALRRRFGGQMQRVEQLSRGEMPSDPVMEASKSRAMQTLDEIENKLSRFTQICLQNVENLREEIRESGQEDRVQTDQVTSLFDSVQQTRMTFDNVVGSNSGTDLLNFLPRMESTADQFDATMNSLAPQNGSATIELVINAAFNNLLRNPPHVGTVKSKRAPRTHSQVQNIPARAFQSGATRREATFNVTANSSIASTSNDRRVVPRPLPTAAVRPTVTPRNPPRQPNRRRRGPQRSKASINVKNGMEDTMTWQLTGIAFVGYSFIVADSFNHLVRMCSISGSSEENQSLYVESPIGVSSMNDPTEVVVTQPNKRQLSIIATDTGYLRIKEVVKTSKPYEAICQMNGLQFVVTCTDGRRSVDIIDRLGRIQTTIERSHLFRLPKYVSVTSNGNILVSDREQKHVVCVNVDGQVQWTHPVPAAPWGVASDEVSKIYVCLDNNTVQTLNEEGQVEEEKFLSQKDNIKVPYAVCARQGLVAVTEYGPSLFAPNSPWVHVVTL